MIFLYINTIMHYYTKKYLVIDECENISNFTHL